MRGGEPHYVTAGEAGRNFGQWQDQAARGPVVVTHHGRPRVVMVSAERFAVLSEDGSDDGSADTAEAALSAFLSHTSEGFFALDHDLTLTAVNRVFEDFTAMPARRMVGRPWPELFPKAARSVAAEHFRRVLRTGEISEFEMLSTVQSGRVLEVRAFPYPSGMGVLFRNVTEERSLARRLRGAGALEAALAICGGVAVVEVNLRGAIAAADAGFEALTGFDTAGLAGCRFADLLVPRTRTAVAEALETVLAKGGQAGVRAVMLCRDGRETAVRLGLAAIQEAGVAGARVVLLPE